MDFKQKQVYALGNDGSGGEFLSIFRYIETFRSYVQDVKVYHFVYLGAVLIKEETAFFTPSKEHDCYVLEGELEIAYPVELVTELVGVRFDSSVIAAEYSTSGSDSIAINGPSTLKDPLVTKKR